MIWSSRYDIDFDCIWFRAGRKHWCRRSRLRCRVSRLRQQSFPDAGFLLHSDTERKLLLHKTAHDEVCGWSCLWFLEEDTPDEFFKWIFLSLWGSHAGWHLVPLYRRESIPTADIFKTLRFTPKQSAWMNNTTVKRKMCIFDLGQTVPWNYTGKVGSSRGVL